jgi:Tol biopolymer transport system component
VSAEWERLESIFQEAQDKPPAAREAFLDEACAGDADLRREVESLLHAGLRGGELFERPAWLAAAMCLPPGTTFGPYQIVGPLGAGGMGDIYRARDTRLGREVAVKVLPRWLAENESALHRFRREARAAAALNHPNVMAVYDVAEVSGSPCIVTELIEGRTLHSILDQRRPSAEAALDYACQILDGLVAAHEKGIVHRDLKPDNLIVTPDGRVKVIDFGLARAAHPGGTSSASTTATAPHQVLGTPPYMSPEQAEGFEVDHRSDIFSFGTVLYEMLTGQKPFKGTSPASVISSILKDTPRPLTEVDSSLPVELTRIVQRCLQKDRELRYQSTKDLRNDLNELRDGGARGRIRWPAKGWLLVAVALGAVGLAVWIVTRQAPGPTEMFKGAAARQLTTGAGWEGDPAVSPDGTQVAYSAEEEGGRHIYVIDIRSGEALRLSNGEAEDRFPCWAPDGASVLFSSDREGGGVFSVSRLGVSNPRLVLPDASEPAMSRDGLVAFVRRPSNSAAIRIFVASPGGSAQARQQTFDQDGLWEHHRPAWSIDGRTVVYRAHMAIWSVGLDRRGATRLTPESQQCDRPAAAPDGSIYYGSKAVGAYALWRLPARGGVAERITLGTGERDPSLSADGRVLAYSTATQDYNLVLEDLRTGAESHFGGVRTEYLPALAPDGREAYFVADNDASRDQIWAVKVADGKFVGTARRLTDLPGQASRATCSPDGKWLLYYKVIGDQRDIWMVSTSGGPPVQLTTDTAPDTTSAWAPDGRRIAFTSERDGHSHIWTLSIADGAPSEAVRLTAGETADIAPVWSPDGKQIAYVATPPNGESDVWIAAFGGRTPPRQVTHGVSAQRVLWETTTGKLLVSAWWSPLRLAVRRVDPASGRADDLEPPVLLGRNRSLMDFDVSRDGRTLIFARDESRGDVWVLNAR